MPSPVIIDRLAWIKKDEIKNLELLKKVMVIWAKIYVIGQPKDEIARPIVLYEETDGLIGLPREYVLKRVSQDRIQDNTTAGEGLMRKINFVGTLNEDQMSLVNKILAHYRSGGYGAILQAPTGTGKTVMACYIISELNLKTLVVVHKEFLMKQWRDRLTQFTDARVGLVQQDIDESDDADVVIAMMQTLISRPDWFKQKFERKFGLVIFDEVHHVSAPVFSTTAKMFGARYRLGLSATPYRKDGTDNVFLWHIGDIFQYQNIQSFKPIIKRVISSDVVVPTIPRYEVVPFEIVLRFLVKNSKRNALIVDLILKALQSGRKVLVTTHRRKHVKIIAELLKEKLNELGLKYSIGYAIGGMKEEILREHTKRNVLIGTYQYIAEGFDVPSLDTLIMATPVSDPVQVVGRILRVYPDKKTPVVVDIIDENIEICVKYFQKRLLKYKALGWQVGSAGDAEEYNKKLLQKIKLED